LGCDVEASGLAANGAECRKKYCENGKLTTAQFISTGHHLHANKLPLCGVLFYVSVRSDGRHGELSHMAEQQGCGSSDDAPQTPAIKLRIKIGHETVVGTKRSLKELFYVLMLTLHCIYTKINTALTATYVLRV